MLREHTEPWDLYCTAAVRGGILEHLSWLWKPRKILIQINNTNPILDEDSAERRVLQGPGVGPHANAQFTGTYWSDCAPGEGVLGVGQRGRAFRRSFPRTPPPGEGAMSRAK